MLKCIENGKMEILRLLNLRACKKLEVLKFQKKQHSKRPKLKALKFQKFENSKWKRLNLKTVEC